MGNNQNINSVMKNDNARIGHIGEIAVTLELLKKGFDVININSYYRNYKNADLVCMNPSTGKSAMIQVKTGTTHNILTGFISETNGTIKDLESSIIGPWVFVYIPEGNYSDVKFYILSKDEVKTLIESSNKWYVTAWNRKLKSKPMVGLEIAWLEGNNTPAKTEGAKRYPEYNNPLGKTSIKGQKVSENRWDKIIDLLK